MVFYPLSSGWELSLTQSQEQWAQVEEVGQTFQGFASLLLLYLLPSFLREMDSLFFPFFNNINTPYFSQSSH